MYIKSEDFKMHANTTPKILRKESTSSLLFGCTRLRHHKERTAWNGWRSIQGTFLSKEDQKWPAMASLCLAKLEEFLI